MKKKLTRLFALLFFSIVINPGPVNAQGTDQWKITGTVEMSKGGALSAVSIMLKGTTKGTTTAADGSYTITVPASPGTLLFSSMNYESQEIHFKSGARVNVTLIDNTKSLNSVVVVGYTSQRKKDIIGAVSVVNTAELLSTPAGNVTNQLQGRAPGVTVAGDGAPGSIAKVRIRGFGSFGGSDPLYVIDGVPSTSAINSLNPNDIESLQVLKDAAAASVYGSRAANGVVIITTKKGKSGATKVTLDSYYGTNYVNKNDFPGLLNAQQYGEMYWRAMKGAGLKPGDAGWCNQQYGTGANPVIPEYIYVNNNGAKYGGAALEGLKITNPTLFASLIDPANYNLATHQIVKSANTDWFDEVFHTAPQQSYQVNVITLHNNKYTLDEMENEFKDRWEFGEVGSVFVKKPGGLVPGGHNIEVQKQMRISYRPIPLVGKDIKRLTLNAD